MNGKSSTLTLLISFCQLYLYNVDGLFHPPSGVVLNFDIQTLSSNSFHVCYDEPYNGITENISFAKCNGSVIFVGAKATESSNVVAVGAFGDVSIFDVTSSTKSAIENNGAYWYFYPGYAFGFSPIASINLKRGDIITDNCEKRLSWHLQVGYGGFRAGCKINLYSNVWRKVVYTSPFYITESPTSSPTKVNETVTFPPTLSPVSAPKTASPTIKRIHKIVFPTLAPTSELHAMSQRQENSILTENEIATGVGLSIAVLSVFIASIYLYNLWQRYKIMSAERSTLKLEERALSSQVTTTPINYLDELDSNIDVDF
mmetsp:Transcript_5591/g.5780  ORF Transcript_5591/g.5780 Transcript_5591/m.5780 type:complete len:315 (+) Transcript_5591:38-982(+)